jgi:hypothetical protein
MTDSTMVSKKLSVGGRENFTPRHYEGDAKQELRRKLNEDGKTKELNQSVFNQSLLNQSDEFGDDYEESVDLRESFCFKEKAIDIKNTLQSHSSSKRK